MVSPAVAPRYTEDDIIDIPQQWMPLFYDEDRWQFYALVGGRGGGKSTAAALALLFRVEYIETVLGRPARVLCLREVQKSVGESCKYLMEYWIRRTGRGSQYKIQADRIITRRGGRILFRGLSDSTAQQIRSVERIDIVWFEEAQDMSERSREVLYPTIFRNVGSEIWFTFNPTRRTDPVYQDFVSPGRRTDIACVMQGNFTDMPPAWRTPEQEMERLLFKENEPDRYAHVWLGELDDEGVENRVLNMARILECIEAYKKGLHKGSGGFIEAGLDVADSNWNALTIREGPAILYAVRWHADDIRVTVQRTHNLALEYGVQRLYYDAGGPGAGVAAYFRNEFASRPYAVRPEMFGGAVKGAEQVFTYTYKNRDYFAQRNAQLGWGVRLRADMTRRLLQGEDVMPGNCLFINPAIPELDRYISQLFQPKWEESRYSRVVLRKADKDESSPDMYDATVLSFAADSINGLRLRSV